MKKYFSLVLFALGLLIFASPVSAATLTLSPASGAFRLGQSFTVNVVVSTPDQALNAASGVVTFPADQLEVTSLSKAGSVIGLWVQEPSLNNVAGTVNFEGVALNPGFTGAAGRVLGINFRVKRAGAARLAFLTPAVLANDGQGTSILTGAGEANFQLTSGEVVPQAPIVSTPAPVGLNITSTTHPDPTKWYRQITAEMAWNLPADARAVRLLVSTSTTAAAAIIYEPAINQKTVTDLTDGVWYFSAQVKTAEGWGSRERFRLQIDTQPPASFSLSEVPRRDPTAGTVQIDLRATDKLSGLDHYALRLDGRDLPPWPADSGETYTLSDLESGSHQLEARAIDRAGNGASASLTIAVEAPPVSPWWRWGTKTIAALSLGVPLLALIILLGLMLEHSHARFRRWQKAVRQEVREAEESIGKAFDLLREDLEKQLSLLERAKNKRELTREERRILSHVRKNLRLAEKYIKKEVEEIEAKIK